MLNFDSARLDVKTASVELLESFGKLRPLESHEIPTWLEALEAIKKLCILMKLPDTADRLEEAIREIAGERK
jgi:hypothetical protein